MVYDDLDDDALDWELNNARENIEYWDKTIIKLNEAKYMKQIHRILNGTGSCS